MSANGQPWAVRFVCTGNGEHPSRLLDVLGYVADLGEVLDRVQALEHRTRRGDAVVRQRQDRDAWVWRCKTCGREPEVNALRMVEVMRQLAAAEKDFVDVSRRRRI